MRTYAEMMDFYSRFCNKNRLRAAAFITWVHKMDEYVFVKHDNFVLAEWCAEMITDIFFEGRDYRGLSDYYHFII